MVMGITNAAVGDLTNNITDYSVDKIELDSPNGMKEYSYTNTNFAQEMGYLETIAELGSTIKAMAKWTVGKGYKASADVKDTLGKIKGWGKDSFNEIVKNAIKIYMASGDSYAEIIKDKSGKLINLKPLNAGKVAIVVDDQGMLKRYEYSQGEKDPIIYQPDEIFHLAWDRIGDQVHGTSIIRRLETIILMRNEAMDDMKTVFHRYVKPLWIWRLNTDKPAEIAAFKAKADKTVTNSENIYVPMGAVEAERVSVPQYSTLDPLPWIDALNQYFYQATNVPDVVLGSAKQTVEASAKMLIFAFEQSVQEHQLFLEEQIKLQLGLEVNFEFPASIATDITDDQKKDGKPTASQPNDTTAGSGK